MNGIETFGDFAKLQIVALPHTARGNGTRIRLDGRNGVPFLACQALQIP